MIVRILFGTALGSGLLLVLAGMRGIEILVRPRMGWRARAHVSTMSTRTRRDETQLVQALAVWTEQLRDTIAGASGLEQAITVTAQTAPVILQPAVERLAARIGFAELSDAIREFSDEVDHPLADFVAAALITAADNHVREMGSLLGHLANCCRDDVAMRTRVWVARARMRSAVRIISAVVVIFIAGLVVLNPQYLAPYGTPTGMVMAVLVAVSFVGGLLAMQRLGRLTTPTRFIARRRETAL